MLQPFQINFDYALDDSRIIIALRATVEFNETENYYQVHSFHSLLPDTHPSVSYSLSLLPDQQIKAIYIEGRKHWVHKESGKESVLSSIIGRAIDEKIENDTNKNQRF